MKHALLAVLLAVSTVYLAAQDCPIPTKEKTKASDPVPLCLVAAKIKLALDDYNIQAEKESKFLPPLAKAEFDFKVVRSTSGGPKISFLIFAIGTTKQVDSTDEVTFSYEVPKKPPIESEAAFADREKSPDFSKELIETLEAAAEQVAQTKNVGQAQFKTVVVNLAYAVKWDFSAGVTVPIQLVTIGGSFDRNKTTTQSVKLTFAE